MISRPGPDSLRIKLAAGFAAGMIGLTVSGVARQTPKIVGEVEMFGVCSYDNSKLACWTPSGRRDAGLERRVDRVLKARSESSFQYRYAMKNRLLVFAQTERSQVSFSSAGSSYFNAIEGRGDDLGPNLRILTIATDPERKTGSIFATVQTGEAEGSAAAPLRDGTEVKLGRGSVTIGLPEVQANPEFRPTNTPETPPVVRRTWTYPLKVDAPEGTTLELRATAIDLEGKAIENVDATGRPIPPPAPTPNDYQNYRQPPISLGWQGNSRKASLLITTIDPAFVREVRWYATLNRRIEFNDFALDPKR